MFTELRNSTIEERIMMEIPGPQCWTFVFEGDTASHECESIKRILRDVCGVVNICSHHDYPGRSILLVADPVSEKFMAYWNQEDKYSEE